MSAVFNVFSGCEYCVRTLSAFPDCSRRIFAGKDTQLILLFFQNTHSKLAQTSASHYHNTMLIGDLFCCDSLANFTFYRNRYKYKQYISENSRAPPKRYHGFKVARRVYDTCKYSCRVIVLTYLA